MPIGKRLDELIKSRNENVNSISNKINISAQTIYSIIKRDNMKVDFDVLVKLAHVLNVNVEYFYEPISVNDEIKSCEDKSGSFLNTNLLSSSEMETLNIHELYLIKLYRECPEKVRSEIDEFVEFKYTKAIQSATSQQNLA